MFDTSNTSSDNHTPVFLDSELISDFIKLTSDQIVQTGQLGNAVAINGNGVIVAGARDDAPDSNYQAGSVVIFTPLEDGTYVEHQLIAPDGVAGEHFGDAVTIADDGTVVVSATTASPDGNSESGAVYVYKPDGNGDYTVPIMLVASDATQLDNFGSSVAINESGQIIVGAAGDDANGDLGAGSIYIYTPEASGGYSEIKLTAPEGEGLANFGSSISFNESGLIVVGAKGELNDTGALYVYHSSLDGYSDPVKLDAPQLQIGDKLGTSVAVNENGQILVSQPGNWIDGGAATGSVLLYTPDADGNYSGSIEFIAADGDASDTFGSAVAINSSGTFVVAAANDEANGYASGSVYVFVPQEDGTYKEFKIGVPDVVAGDGFGFAVAISEDGTVTIGKPGNDSTTEINTGAIYVIKPDPNGDYSRTANELALYETTDTSDIVGQLSLSFSDADVTDVGHTANIKGLSLSGVQNGLNKLTEQQLLDLLTIGSIDTSDQSLFGKVNLDFTAGYEVFNYLAEDEEVTLTYTVELDDGNGGTTEGTAKIIIIGTNDTPHADDVAVTVSEDDRDYLIQTGLVDPDRSDRLAITWDDDSVKGKLERYGNNFEYSAFPHFNYLAEGESATETFTYTADDGHGGVITRNVTITVEGENDRPIVRDIEATTLENQEVGIAPDYSDVDASDTHTISFDSREAKGTVTFIDGVFHYDPNGQFDHLLEKQRGYDTFTYTVDDGHGGIVTKTVTVTIVGVVDPVSDLRIEALPNNMEIVPQINNDYDQYSHVTATSENGVIVVGAPHANLTEGIIHVYQPDGFGSYIETRISPSDGQISDYFGWHVAINQYGTIVTGAYRANDDHGAIYIYEPDGNGGYTETKLTSSLDQRELFGSSVSIGDDGTIVVGAYWGKNNTETSGATYIYKPDGSGGYLETRLAPDDISLQDAFGKDVMINSEGIVVVGSPSNDDLGFEAGAIFVYRPQASRGYEEVKLHSSDAAERDQFGENITINDDGVIVVGVPTKKAVYVYTPDETGTYYETKLGATNNLYQEFGEAVDINSNGLIVVGVPGYTYINSQGDRVTNLGGVAVYTPDTDGGYTEQFLIPPIIGYIGRSHENGRFGTSVSISDSGVVTVGFQTAYSHRARTYQLVPDAEGQYSLVKSEATIDETSDYAPVQTAVDVVFYDKHVLSHTHEGKAIAVEASGNVDGLDTTSLLEFLTSDGFSRGYGDNVPAGYGRAHFTFDAPAHMFDYLNRGENVTLIYTIEIDNGSNTPTSTEIKITINGRDDVGTVASDTLTGSDFNDTMLGLQGEDTIDGGKGADFIDGGEGNDTLTGGSSSDTFRFVGVSFGNDVITDFEAGSGIQDLIKFDQTAFADFNAIIEAASENGADTVITLGISNSVTLKNVSIAELNQDDFQFV
ncbi:MULTISPECIES: VCBS domain-containing protein [unclassified Pseudovibrio]|uniref:VCBS domain-containing protein n=1 Tax=unclassified Pseudovibrio TaxID=2627060 RepID=UPI0007AE5D13|nr:MULTISPECIES: VCBS domain-containing protein [unclassified Pseudovibrio]KZK93279.1 Poly(beta-D-mannuronate) C5 epimerase 2 [Pseudovibrio sp. W74]KZL07170.1 Poly(beta-D-mannuronate) C5 epimerase 2 [Pseudovibrio sp. Ad14]